MSRNHLPGPATASSDHRLRDALAPYLERNDGETGRAVTELLTDLRYADGEQVDAAFALTAPQPRGRAQHPEQTDGGAR